MQICNKNINGATDTTWMGPLFYLNELASYSTIYPRLVEALSGRAVAMVACGDEHTVVLMRDGTVLSFGANSHGQLGRKTQDNRDKVPGKLVWTGTRRWRWRLGGIARWW